MKLLKKIDKNLERWVMFLLLAGMTLVLGIQIFCRFVLNNSLTWSEELARYIFVWMALLGSAWCGRGHIHVRMTAVTSKFPMSLQRIQMIAISVVCAATCFILFPHACSIFVAQSKIKAVTLGVSLGIEYIAAPVGIMMMAIQWTVDALYALFDWDGYKERYMKKEDE